MATKCDDEAHRQVTEERALQFADEQGIPIFFTSAHTNTNVAESFTSIAQQAVEKQQQQMQSRDGQPGSANGGMNLSKKAGGKKKVKCCNL